MIRARNDEVDGEVKNMMEHGEGRVKSKKNKEEIDGREKSE